MIGIITLTSITHGATSQVCVKFVYFIPTQSITHVIIIIVLETMKTLLPMYKRFTTKRFTTKRLES